MDFQNAQIATIYDLANPLGQDTEFYLALAGVQSCSVLDLGCGTGTLCCALAERGHRVTGVDPSAEMLALARKKSHAERVVWVESSAQRYRSRQRLRPNRHFTHPVKEDVKKKFSPVPSWKEGWLASRPLPPSPPY